MSASTVPTAPLTPIYVVLRKTLTGNLIHAILPYVDIPNKEKKHGKFAFVLANGLRGSITQSMIEGETEPCSVKEAEDIDVAMRNQHWEPIYIKYEDIDFKRHFELRVDDGIHDQVSFSMFKDLNDWITCAYCGHPNESHLEQCEACDLLLVTGEVPVIELDFKQTGFNFEGGAWE